MIHISYSHTQTPFQTGSVNLFKQNTKSLQTKLYSLSHEQIKVIFSDLLLYTRSFAFFLVSVNSSIKTMVWNGIVLPDLPFS